MSSFLKRIFSRHNDRGDTPSLLSAEYRFEQVLTAADILNQFAEELRTLSPPEIPGNIASTRGWAIRFEALEEYCPKVPTGSLKSLATKLDRPIEVLSSYVRRWDRHVSKIDPLLRTYEIMPGEKDAVDSVRVLLYRAIHAKQVAVSELSSRC